MRNRAMSEKVHLLPPILRPFCTQNRSRLVDHSMTASTTTMLSRRLEAAITNNIIMLTSHSLALRCTDHEQQKQDQWQQKQTVQCKKSSWSYFTSHSPPVLHSDRSRLVHSALFSPLNSKTILFSILNQSTNWSESIHLLTTSYFNRQVSVTNRVTFNSEWQKHKKQQSVWFVFTYDFHLCDHWYCWL